MFGLTPDIVTVALTAAGLIVGLWLFVSASWRQAQWQQIARRLARLARKERADEARIEARQQGRVFRPVLEALSGQPASFRGLPMAADTARLLLLAALPSSLVAYGVWALRALGPEERMSVVQGLMLGLAILVPVCLVCGVAVVASRRRGHRMVRSAAIEVMACLGRSHGELDAKSGRRARGG